MPNYQITRKQRTERSHQSWSLMPKTKSSSNMNARYHFSMTINSMIVTTKEEMVLSWLIPYHMKVLVIKWMSFPWIYLMIPMMTWLTIATIKTKWIPLLTLLMTNCSKLKIDHGLMTQMNMITLHTKTIRDSPWQYLTTPWNTVVMLQIL